MASGGAAVQHIRSNDFLANRPAHSLTPQFPATAAAAMSNSSVTQRRCGRPSSTARPSAPTDKVGPRTRLSIPAPAPMQQQM